MYTFLFWMVHCVIWDRCIVGFVRLLYSLTEIRWFHNCFSFEVGILMHGKIFLNIAQNSVEQMQLLSNIFLICVYDINVESVQVIPNSSNIFMKHYNAQRGGSPIIMNINIQCMYIVWIYKCITMLVKCISITFIMTFCIHYHTLLFW